MKIPALLAALAIASGSAMAAGNSDTGKHSAAADTQRSAAERTDHSGPSFVDKTKNAFRRMGDKLSRMTHTDKNRSDSASRENDTRAMGAAGSDTHDSGRRSRMDEAYSNYQNKQGKQDKTNR
jgi:hypothetical protein